MKPIRVFFLCRGNSCRSILAEALLRARGGDRFEPSSGGTEPKGVHPLTIDVLREMGIETAAYRSKSISEGLGGRSQDYVIAVCGKEDESCPNVSFGAAERLHWPFDDPPAFQGSREECLAEFRRVRDQIDQRIQSWIPEVMGSRA
jgi:arsenate reductase